MLDITKYEYIDLDVSNVKVIWECKYDHKRVAFSVHKSFSNFIYAAAKKYPMWTFISPHKGGQDNVDTGNYAAQAFLVYDGTEKLGRVEYGYNSKGEVVFLLKNDRIENERERGSAATTKDVNKAIKILGKKFGAKTLDERLDEATSLSGRLYNIASDKTGTFYSAYGELTSYLREHLMENWDAIKGVAISKGADVKSLDKIPGVYEEHVEARKIYDHYTAHKGAIVILHGADYAVRYMSDDGNGEEEDDEAFGNCTTIYSTETLPDWIKRGVGMLKLIEKDNLVSNVGYKIDRSSFFVMKGDA